VVRKPVNRIYKKKRSFTQIFRENRDKNFAQIFLHRQEITKFHCKLREKCEWKLLCAKKFPTTLSWSSEVHAAIEQTHPRAVETRPKNRGGSP
jgi:hypothetical protein